MSFTSNIPQIASAPLNTKSTCCITCAAPASIITVTVAGVSPFLTNPYTLPGTCAARSSSAVLYPEGSGLASVVITLNLLPIVLSDGYHYSLIPWWAANNSSA